jgi:VWFA-related protein
LIIRYHAWLLAVSCGALLAAADDTVVFRSEVGLVRVDAQVVDRNNRAITGLGPEDFVLREEGQVQQIRNFAREDMPLDVLLLLDVSASMRPHVQRIADAAHEAMTVLGADDRVGIMVFDRNTRLRMPFRKGRSNVEREMDSLLRQETFRGGTDITRGMYDAANYVKREGRREARRAIVILTDDETEFNRDDEGVLRSLERSDAVMSALIAPDAMGTRRMGRMPQGGSWPGGGPSIGGPLGGIILGRRGGYGGRGPGGGNMGHHTSSAGTAEIARRSGGDSMPVDDASSLETTLSRLRQRYALHFYAPANVRTGQEHNIQLALAANAQRRYPDAEVRYRRVYLAPDSGGAPPSDGSNPVVVTRAGSNPEDRPAEPSSTSSGLKRRRAVNEDGSAVQPQPAAQSAAQSDAAPATPRAAEATPQSEAPATTIPKPRGWRRVDEPSNAPGPKDAPKAKTDDRP